VTTRGAAASARAFASWIACVASGCGAAKAPLPSNATEGDGPTAERAFRDSLALDHASPAERRAVAARKRAGDLFARDCQSGIPEACWWARALLDEDARFDAQIAANCAGGHALSCRAAKPQFGLSRVQLHDGCVAGILSECIELAQTTDSVDESAFAWERACGITRSTCRSAAEAFLESEPRDTVKARDMLELACSSGRSDDCLVLGAAYSRGDLVEPVRGRGDVVRDYACGTTPQRAGAACAQGTNVPLIRPKIDI
jgi:hypothetical protein